MCSSDLPPTLLLSRYGKGPKTIHLHSRWTLRHLPARDPDVEPRRVSASQRPQAAKSSSNMAAPKMTKNQMRRAKKKELKQAREDVLITFSGARDTCFLPHALTTS